MPVTTTEESRTPVVVVTGCSSGIGRAIVAQLSAGGSHVVAGVRRKEDAAGLPEGRGKIVPLIMDVADPISIDRAVVSVQRQFPDGIDGLVNNAGIAVIGPLELVPHHRWQSLFDVNFFGVVNVTRGFLPMLRLRRGRIVNISSPSGFLAFPMAAPYASSKFAVEGLTDSLRRELSPSGIRVVIVCPGQTATRIFDKTEQGTQAQLQSALATSSHNYMSTLKRLQELIHQTENARNPPDRVAKVVDKALRARWPKRRYRVGWDARASAWLQWLLPDAVMDWGIAWLLRERDNRP